LLDNEMSAWRRLERSGRDGLRDMCAYVAWVETRRPLGSQMSLTVIGRCRKRELRESPFDRLHARFAACARGTFHVFHTPLEQLQPRLALTLLLVASL